MRHVNLIFFFFFFFVLTKCYFEISEAFPKTKYSLSSNDYNFGVCDFNGDGKDDLVHLANEKYVHVWLSEGNGKFNITKRFPKNNNYNVDGNKYKFIKGDFNGDGKCDLAHIVEDSYLHIWLSRGDGSFKIAPGFPKTSYSLAGNDFMFRPGDFNGDGKTDLIHFATKKYAHVWLSKGDGKFKIAKKFPNSDYDVSANQYMYRVADFNGDGKSDVLHIQDAVTLQLWISKGDGDFTLPPPFTIENMNLAANEFMIHVGDFNGDGKADLVHFAAENHLLIYFSNGDGTFNITDPFPNDDYKIATNNYNIKVGDFNGDGLTDLIHFVTNHYFHVWLSKGDGTFEILDEFPMDDYSLATNNYNFKLGDFNGDGKEDLVHFVNNRYLHVFMSTVNQTDLDEAHENANKRKYKKHDEF